MSLRHGLLGLLAEGPASGYDLARHFEQALGSVWPAQHPRIYAELSRLSETGLIEVDSHGPRRRTAYRITDAGLAEVRRWLAEDETDHTFRVEALLRAYFFWLMEPQELTEHLRRERDYYTRTASTLRGYARAKDRGEWGTSPQTRAMRVAIEAGIRVNEALIAWTEWAERSDVMSAEGFGTGPGTDPGTGPETSAPPPGGDAREEEGAGAREVEDAG